MIETRVVVVSDEEIWIYWIYEGGRQIRHVARRRADGTFLPFDEQGRAVLPQAITLETARALEKMAS